MSFTCRSFSAVGLFFGFLVSANLTKWWKLFVLFDRKTNKKKEKVLPVWSCRSSVISTGCWWIIWKQKRGSHHFSLSFNFGGWKLLLLIKKSALKGEDELRRQIFPSPPQSFQSDWKLERRFLSYWGAKEQKRRMQTRYLMGCSSNMGGCSSASSIAVMPTAQMSHSWL